MRVAVVQHDIVWEDPDANLERLGATVEDAVAGGDTDLVVLTEMFSTGFSMAAEHIAEAPDGPSATFLLDRARATGAWMCGSIPTRTPGVGRPQNVLTVASPDGTVHRYAKIHPFSYSGESDHYDPGTEFLTVEISGCRVSFFVCYDLRFADEFWVRAPVTDAYVIVANWPAPRRRHWLALLQARAIENQAYVVAANRVGVGGGLDYAGDSRVFDPMGDAIAAADDAAALLRADVDPAVVADVRARFPFLDDRR
ncbi:MAG: carbon-nitrogen family hydrolase [Acidimicrobiia bacterium]|nr:carbon-nitrogen family hydrolase [Acidimicrobiia bacterium]